MSGAMEEIKARCVVRVCVYLLARCLLQTLVNDCQCLAGFLKLHAELTAALQHVCELVELRLHPSAVFLVILKHLIFYQLAHLTHLTPSNTNAH